MLTSDVKAFAKAFVVVKKALERVKQEVTANDIDYAAEHPAEGFTRLLMRAVKNHAISNEDNDLIAAFIDEVDGAFEDEDKTTADQCCTWFVIYYQWQDLYTASEAAKMLGVTKQRISALKKAGKLEYVSVHGRDYFPNATIEQRRLKDKKEAERASRMVENSYGVAVDFDVAVNLMDDDLREELNAELAPCSDQEFFDAYARAHEERFGEEWEPDKPNPQL